MSLDHSVFPYSTFLETEHSSFLPFKHIYLILKYHGIELRWPKLDSPEDIYQYLEYEIPFQVGWAIELEKISHVWFEHTKEVLPPLSQPYTEESIPEYLRVQQVKEQEEPWYDRIKLFWIQNTYRSERLDLLGLIRDQKPQELPKTYLNFILNLLDIRLSFIPADRHHSGFYMAQTPITQAQYYHLVGYNPSDVQGFEAQSYPVVNVSWLQSLKFCNLLSEYAGLEKVYQIFDNHVSTNAQASGFRLPTQDEWHFAALGGEPYAYAGSDTPDDTAWFFENTRRHTMPVAQKKPNGYGLYDMCGNVSEWTSTGEHLNEEEEILKVACGGSWLDKKSEVGVNSFFEAAWSENSVFIGLRVMTTHSLD